MYNRKGHWKSSFILRYTNMADMTKMRGKRSTSGFPKYLQCWALPIFQFQFCYVTTVYTKLTRQTSFALSFDQASFVLLFWDPWLINRLKKEIYCELISGQLWQHIIEHGWIITETLGDYRRTSKESKQQDVYFASFQIYSFSAKELDILFNSLTISLLYLAQKYGDVQHIVNI